MVLELESLSAVCALEPPEDGGLVVGDHVPLQPVHVGELLLAHLANLQRTRATNRLRTGRVIGNRNHYFLTYKFSS